MSGETVLRASETRPLAKAAEGRSIAKRPGAGRIGSHPPGVALAAASSLPDRTP